MQPFKTHRGRLAVLDWTDVNTDLIIPARYLKRIERTGYGPLLFADKRYAAGAAPPVDAPEKRGAEDDSFPLNDPRFKGATILVVGKNFGCGSSREHAVWAVAQAGYRVIIAPGKNEGFADIFEGNAYNNGLLPLELPEDQWKEIAQAASSDRGAEATIDLAENKIHLHVADRPDATYDFTIPEAQRQRLLKGLDAIAETMLHDERIRAFEARLPEWNVPAAT